MSKTRVTAAARVVGVTLGAIMVVYLFTYDGVWESDNAFLVPDILMGALLLTTSLLPHRFAAPAMTFAFGWTAGILTVTVFEYLNRGEFPYVNFVMALAATATFVLLLTRAPAASGMGEPARSVA